MAPKGKVLGVLGLGRIGGPVATIGLGFGMEVIAWSPNLTAERCAEKGVKLSGIDTLLVRSDVIAIHLPARAATEGLIGAPELALMKPAALLINVSRASIVDERALINALREGRIGGAGLDVFSVEPVPPTHPPISVI